MSNSSLATYTKISPNKTSPRNHSIDTITIHCVVGQLSAESIASCFARSNVQASCNYGIGTDGRIALIVPEKDRSWCSSNRENDNRAITIECASDTTPPYAINENVYNSLIDLESYGHDIEASWLIYRACEVLEDEKVTEDMMPVIMGLALSAYNNGIDRENNAMNDECEKGIVNAKKVWWVQAESVTGFYNAYTLDSTKAEYLTMSNKVWEYINNYVMDKKTGEWVEDGNPDNTINKGQALVHPWKCPYHNGRMCFEVIKRS